MGQCLIKGVIVATKERLPIESLILTTTTITIIRISIEAECRSHTLQKTSVLARAYILRIFYRLNLEDLQTRIRTVKLEHNK